MEQHRLKRIVKRGLEKKKKKLNKSQQHGTEITEEDTSAAKNGQSTSGANNADVCDIEASRTSGKSVSSGILSDTSFSSLEGRVSDLTLRGISEMGLTQMTKIQAEAIPHLLQGRDLVGAAQTGSGKTLAYLIPGIETLHRLSFTPRNGAGMMVIVPTRELSIQTYAVAREACKHHALTVCMLMGGASRTDEATKLARGASIVIATPGRLLDHLRDTPEFVYKNLQVLVIDEADRLLESGFEEELKQIITLLPKRRQTVLLSATLNAKTEDLTRLAVQKKPVEIRIETPRECATVAGLEQGYVVCASDRRFLLLFTFLRKNVGKKNMVFLSACSTVQFYADLLNYVDLPVMAIHGRQKQSKRTATFMRFCAAESGTLLCTDVAARGLDIPRVDWIIQYDPPDDPREYVHRVGRTARGEGARGNALVFLLSEELGFLRYLRDAKVHLQEYEFSWNKVADIQNQLEKLIERNYFLHQSARDAFKAYIRAYASHSLKQIFDVNKLDLKLVAKSFGFDVPPFVDLNVYSARSEKRTKKRRFEEEESSSAPVKKKMVYKPLAKR